MKINLQLKAWFYARFADSEWGQWLSSALILKKPQQTTNLQGMSCRWYKTINRELQKVLHLDTMLQAKALHESQK